MSYISVRSIQKIILSLSVGLFAPAALWSCRTAAIQQAALPPVRPHTIRLVSPVPQPLTPEELLRVRPNESGVVPIMEYHAVKTCRFMTCRSAALIRSDLAKLYDNGFLPITLKEYLNDRIALPAGRKPVLLSFDDALITQFRYLENGSIDPNCAVGILQAFHAKHPQWALHGVFFVLPPHAFGPYNQRAKKLNALLKLGFEIENHTQDHYYFNRISDGSIIRQIALGQEGIEKLVPGYKTDVLALPGGCLPRSRHYGIMTSGDYDGIRYHNRAIIMAADDPAPAPADRRYNPLRIPRIVACPGSDGIDFWISWMKRHPSKVYVSDGNPNVITVPAAEAHLIDRKKLQGAELKIYGKLPEKPHSHKKKRQEKI